MNQSQKKHNRTTYRDSVNSLRSNRACYYEQLSYYPIFLFFFTDMTKASLNFAPDEILFNIFQDLSQRDLNVCQRVCRSWYLPAHLLFLKELHMKDTSDVDQFLAFIGRSPLYLDTVKKLELGDGRNTTRIDREKLKQLLSYRFSNVRTLFIYGSVLFEDLVKDLEMRQLVAAACPIIESVPCVSVGEGQEIYIKEFKKDLKHSLTTVGLGEEDTLEFLCDFSQLQELDVSEAIGYSNFQSWLPIFEHPYQLKKLHGSFKEEDPDQFAETYLRLKTDKERSVILEKLSKLEMLCIEEATFVDPNTIQFIAGFLTGIETFNFYAQHWPEEHADTFNGAFLDVITRSTTGNIDITCLLLKKYLDDILKKTLQPRPSPKMHCVTRELQLLYDESVDFDFQGLSLKSEKINDGQMKRHVCFVFSEYISFMRYVQTTLTVGYCRDKNMNINAFRFTLRKKYITDYLSILQETLDKLASVTKVALTLIDIPNDDGKQMLKKTRKKRYHRVTHLELSSFKELTQTDTFLAFVSMFPDIQYLRMFYFSGIRHDNRYMIPIDHMVLERLYLDVSPVFKTLADTNTFFVLEVQQLSKNAQKQRYKVFYNDLRIALIDGETQEEKNALHVDIVVYALNYLTLYLYKDILDGHSFFSNKYIESCVEDIMEARISFM